MWCFVLVATAATCTGLAADAEETSADRLQLVEASAAAVRPPLMRREASANEEDQAVSRPQVWCGTRFASSCSECAQNQGSNLCNGDCAWDHGYNDCLFRSDLMWCGAHATTSCQECVWDKDKFRGRSWCNGECYWLEENEQPGQCFAKYPNAPPLPPSTPPPNGYADTRKGKSFLVVGELVGSSMITVASEFGFHVGATIMIGNVPFGEERDIVGFGSLLLNKPLKHNYPRYTIVQVVRAVFFKNHLPQFSPYKKETKKPWHPNATRVYYTKRVEAKLANLTKFQDLERDPGAGLAWALFLALSGFACVAVVLFVALIGFGLYEYASATAALGRDAVQKHLDLKLDGTLEARRYHFPVDRCKPVGELCPEGPPAGQIAEEEAEAKVK